MQYVPTLCHFTWLDSTFRKVTAKILTSLVFIRQLPRFDLVYIPLLLNVVIYSISIMLQTCLPGGLVVRIPRFHRGGRGSIPRLGNTFSLILVYIGAKTIFPPI